MNRTIHNEELPYRVGGLLYTPALNRSIARKLLEGQIPSLSSLAFCLEDAITDESLADAQKLLRITLGELSGASSELPLLFVRVRTPEHMAQVHEELGELEDLLTGYIAPKFDESNADGYCTQIEQWNKDRKNRLYLMPILESHAVAHPANRISNLLNIKNRIDMIRPYILNVRAGGNDFSNLFGLRRNSSQTIYDIGMIQNILTDILSIFSADYVVSGPVWEYFGSNDQDPWAQGLRRELELDLLNGFIGKTAIHPSQLPVIAESLKVDLHDYEDARRIVSWSSEGLGVGKSANKDRMNEVKCHQKWAEKILLRARIYGIRTNEENEEAVKRALFRLHQQEKISLHPYAEDELLQVAKRVNNPKRSYLLVNPLQAKHVPVSPNEALQMMENLAAKVLNAVSSNESLLVIGFAETATAIAREIAKSLGEDTGFIHTTREKSKDAGSFLFFSEEHSHAAEQKLVADRLSELIDACDTVLFVDDEFTTGKTLLNMIRVLEQKCPNLAERRKIAVSVICRLNDENRQRWTENSLESISLLDLPEGDFDREVSTIEASLGTPFAPSGENKQTISQSAEYYAPDARIGFLIREENQAAKEQSASDLDLMQTFGLHPDENVLVLGTEEFMYEAIALGKALEDCKKLHSVRVHATTRSPIGICSDEGYPIGSGHQIPSFYDPQRTTYLYNIGSYDAVFFVTDAENPNPNALEVLMEMFGKKGCTHFIEVRRRKK